MSGGEFHDEWCPLNGCRCGNCGPCAQMPECPTNPPAVAAPTGTSEDVEALADSLGAVKMPDGYALNMSRYERRLAAQAVLASDWLAAHDAATADRVRRETAERIAAGIEADGPPADYPGGTVAGRAYRRAARIAREQAR